MIISLKKITKVSRNNFKINIKGISGQLEMSKNNFININPYLSSNKIFYPMLHLKR